MKLLHITATPREASINKSLEEVKELVANTDWQGNEADPLKVSRNGRALAAGSNGATNRLKAI
ncbi:MAG: hypothetical protein ACK2UN_11865 [Candidatus Promineifilaceae bacterium]|jgi:hypothetical protein